MEKNYFKALQIVLIRSGLVKKVGQEGTNPTYSFDQNITSRIAGLRVDNHKVYTDFTQIADDFAAACQSIDPMSNTQDSVAAFGGLGETGTRDQQAQVQNPAYSTDQNQKRSKVA